MDYAIFKPDGDPIARFMEDQVAIPEDAAERMLAENLLWSGAGAYVDALCTLHDGPRSNCRHCETQIRCAACDWPGYACPAHR